MRSFDDFFAPWFDEHKAAIEAQEFVIRPYGFAADYGPSLTAVLEHEGGYTNDAADPGGPTNWGITIADARMYWKKDAGAADVRAMPLSVAKAIYRSKYWDAQRCDDLPAGVDYAVFDYGVNSGIGRSERVLQGIVGAHVDGSIGPETVAAARKADPVATVKAICDERLAFLQQLKTWPVFGRGWGRRVAEVRMAALRMAAAPPVAPTKPASPAPKPAPAPQPKPAPAPAKTGLWAAILNLFAKGR